MNINSIFLTILFSASCISVLAQGTYLPIGSEGERILDRLEVKYGHVLPVAHTGVKPYDRKTIAAFAESLKSSNIALNRIELYDLDYLLRDNSEWADSIHYNPRPLLKFFYKNQADLYSVDVKDFKLRVNPVIQFQIGTESDDSKIKFRNTRGAELRAYVKEKIGFYSYLADNQYRGPLHTKAFIQEFDAVPGRGYYKEFKEDAVDFFEARGYMTFNVLQYFDFQLGYDRHFLGYGKRSLFLSDFSNSMYFLNWNTRIWKLNYKVMWAEMNQQYDRGLDRLLPKKYATFHHLNLDVNPHFDIGLFEAVVFNRSNQFEFHYLNPLIFYRAVEQSVGSPDNVILGLDFKTNFLNAVSVYGQFALDEFNFNQLFRGEEGGWWGNKYGLQLGLKYIDVGNISNLDFQTEINIVRPYTYTHVGPLGDSLANYSHYNQPLAHPLGANFIEWLAEINYRPIPRLNFKLKYFNINQGLDSTGQAWGANIFYPANVNTIPQEYNNVIGQGIGTRTNLMHFITTYQVYHNIFLDLQFSFRNRDAELSDLISNNSYVLLGARMNIPYRTEDY